MAEGGGHGRAITYLPPGLEARQVAEAFLRAAEFGDLDTWLATLSGGGFAGGGAGGGGPIAEHGWARTRKRLADYGARHAFEAEDGEGDERAVRFRATFGSVPGYQEGDPLRPTALQGGASAVVRLVREYGEWRVTGLSHPSVPAAAAAAA